jgi:hypothetical protein
VLLFSLYNNANDHGVMVQALDWWWHWHLGASHEATNTLHRLMCLASYESGGMVVAFTIDSFTFFYIKDNRLAKKLIITLTVNRFNDIASTGLSHNPSPVSCLHWIGCEYKIRAAGGGGSSPWWGWFCCLLCQHFCTSPYVDKL